MNAFDEIKSAPKSKNITSIVGTAVLNSLGGIFAGRVRGLLSGFAPTIKSAGTLGVFFSSIALRFYAKDERGWNLVLREIAAGMAGYVGNDLWIIARALIGWDKWKPETPYKAGDIVTHNNNYYKTDKDIDARPSAEPGKDARWVRFEMAQGYAPDEISSFAQALSSNDALLDGMVKEQVLIFGPELAQCVGRELSQEEANQIYSGMRDSLKSVVQKFSA